ncbi:MAG: hypothetical protein JNM27_21345 [Leptospirales bacterium]|nr:hypothetical protein [Leptospirales bacterium]
MTTTWTLTNFVDRGRTWSAQYSIRTDHLCSNLSYTRRGGTTAWLHRHQPLAVLKEDRPARVASNPSQIELPIHIEFLKTKALETTLLATDNKAPILWVYWESWRPEFEILIAPRSGNSPFSLFYQLGSDLLVKTVSGLLPFGTFDQDLQTLALKGANDPRTENVLAALLLVLQMEWNNKTIPGAASSHNSM